MKMVLACDSIDSGLVDIECTKFLIADIACAKLDIRCVVANKGYDAEHFHVNVVGMLGARTAVPVRNNAPKKGCTVYRTIERNRRRMKHEFSDSGSEISVAYRKHSVAETVNPMIKRNMGDTVHRRTEVPGRIETFLRRIAHNIRRLTDLRHRL